MIARSSLLFVMAACTIGSQPVLAQDRAASPAVKVAPADAKASKASKDPTKIDLGKEEAEKQRRAALAQCLDACLPSNVQKTSSGDGPDCSKLWGNAQIECLKKALGASASSGFGAALGKILNEPKVKACTLACYKQHGKATPHASPLGKKGGRAD